MASKLLILALVITLAALFASSSAYVGDYLPVGVKTELYDVGLNGDVQKLGRFAVEEYNRQLRRIGFFEPPNKRRQGRWLFGGGGGGSEAQLLVFAKVVRAQRQVESSALKYFLTVTANGDGGSADGGAVVFDAVVTLTPWTRAKHLVSFSRN